MGRKRHQNPKPFVEGAWWYIRLWQDDFVNGEPVRKLKRIKLADHKEKFRKVQKLADEIVRPMNQSLITVGAAISFADYVKTVYEPTKAPLSPKAVRQSYAAMIRKYLTPAFGRMSLNEISTRVIQTFFSGMPARGVPFPSIVKSRDALSHVLRSAHEYEYLTRNPMKGVQIPPDTREETGKPFLQPAQFANLLELIPEPYATMVNTAVWTGLRVSELIGLKWRHVGEDSLRIEKSYFRGDWGKPKTGASKASISVLPDVIERIHRLKLLTVEVRAGNAVRRHKVVKSSEPDDVVFQSVQKGKPMNDQNVLRRHIRPAALKLGLKGIDWRCLRRTCATWMVHAGADPKSVQGQMRHSRITTTMEIYAQLVPGGQKRASEQMSEYVQKSILEAVTNRGTVAVQ